MEQKQLWLEGYTAEFVHRCTVLSQITVINKGVNFKYLCQFKTKDLEKYLDRLDMVRKEIDYG